MKDASFVSTNSSGYFRYLKYQSDTSNGLTQFIQTEPQPYIFPRVLSGGFILEDGITYAMLMTFPGFGYGVPWSRPNDHVFYTLTGTLEIEPQPEPKA